ncbi:hypothetical protein [Cellulomonas sp. ATA003]|uniref:hypothetical protein n=1 Tax=Cellulomonas sp. ATA003 TaxID=3073064 RepID=UPI0028733BA3|nr:hypothetical protein [Cellulomonas sp. ATA003]WNB86905.1 hypothetical protein REH70_07020 [Cellulomonas sp. ATA003]
MTDERCAPSPTSLSVLEADRAALAERARTPSWLAPALGAVTAAWVATAATARPGGPASWYLLLLVGIALTTMAVRSTGVRTGRVGVRGGLGYLALVAVVLVLYSVALGLASLDLHAWAAVPVVLTFGATVVGVRSIDAAARRTLRHAG